MTCLACGSADTAHWAKARDVEYCSTPESFDYLHCGDCAALSIDPVPLGRLGEIYPDTYYSFAPGKLSLAERVKQALDRRTFRTLFAGVEGDTLSALDVGGGAGFGDRRRAWLLPRPDRGL